MRAVWWGLALMAGSAVFGCLPGLAGVAPFWPAAVALGVILATRQAAIGLAAGVLAGAMVEADGLPHEALRLAFQEHVFPQLGGTWHVAALVFTLLLGAFAGLLEHCGGFDRLLERLTHGGRDAKRRVLGATYGLGLMCFFDGLANSLLVGRVGRAAVDRVGISREKLAWVVDSTSSPIACVAFISTWIATQLTLIGDSLPEANAYAVYFRSIPGNPYCVLTLLLVPLAIFLRWEPRAMRRFRAVAVTSEIGDRVTGEIWRVVVPLASLAVGIAIGFQAFSGNPVDWLSLDAWREATSGQAGPLALAGGATLGLLVAWGCYPRGATKPAAVAAREGAAGLLPALVILILAWSLGSVFESLGAARAMRDFLGESFAPRWLPLAVFGTAAATAFSTGSSWGTMALWMPLALGVLTETADAEALAALAPATVGAVFGGAVFGDHASPFSDTTIVSALAAGCEPLDHVMSQLPYVTLAATASGMAYVMMALGLPMAAATLIGAVGMAGWVVWKVDGAE